MSKKKLTNKEITKAINVLRGNDEILWQQILEMRQAFGLYLDHKKETETFNKFVKAKTEEFEKQKRSEIKT